MGPYQVLPLWVRVDLCSGIKPEEQPATTGEPISLCCLTSLSTESKLRPVLDFHELNGHVNAYTAHAYVCTQKLTVEKEKLQRIGAQSLKGLLTGACAQILVAVPDLSLKGKGTA